MIDDNDLTCRGCMHWLWEFTQFRAIALESLLSTNVTTFTIILLFSCVYTWTCRNSTDTSKFLGYDYPSNEKFTLYVHIHARC